jgi:hypothetical protein
MRAQDSTKRCYKCGESLALESFSLNKNAKDGRCNLCKSCTKAYRRQYNKSEKGITSRNRWKATRAESDMQYFRSEKAKETRRKWEQTDAAKQSRKRRNSERNASEPWRGSVTNAVHSAVHRGDLPAPDSVPCESGPDGCYGGNVWHHDSYLREDWLNVRCLCRSHHIKWHTNNEPTRPGTDEKPGN